MEQESTSAPDFRLVVKSGPNPGTPFDLTKEVTLLGRDVTNDITLGDAEVSRQHARLTQTPGGYVLEDLGSTNGSFVNGERLVAPRVLASGDLIGMGENVTLSFEATSPEAAETLMAGAVRHGAAPAPEAVMPGTTRSEQEIAEVATEAEGRRIKPWMLAGAGCLVLVVLCVGTLVVLDQFFDEWFYDPSRPWMQLLSLIGFTP